MFLLRNLGIAQRKRFPDVQNRFYQAPAGLDHTGTLEQRCITVHAVLQQPLVSGCWFRAEDHHEA
jgi:hypothetical protein